MLFFIFAFHSIHSYENMEDGSGWTPKLRFLYSAVSSPLDRSKRFTLFAPPPRIDLIRRYMKEKGINIEEAHDRRIMMENENVMRPPK